MDSHQTCLENAKHCRKSGFFFHYKLHKNFNILSTIKDGKSKENKSNKPFSDSHIWVLLKKKRRYLYFGFYCWGFLCWAVCNLRDKKIQKSVLKIKETDFLLVEYDYRNAFLIIRNDWKHLSFVKNSFKLTQKNTE